MKTGLTSLVIALVLLLNVASMPVSAQGPVGSCPPSFELHEAHHHDHDGEHSHHHIGTDTDKNADGYLCMKHVGKHGNNHVHIDNNLPLAE